LLATGATRAAGENFYVNGATGDDTIFDGSSPTPGTPPVGPKKTIQAAGNGEFEEWLTLQNANAGPITVDATYQLGKGKGENVTRSYSVAAGMRQTVYVPSEVGENKDVSVLLTCGSDFLAEPTTGHGREVTTCLVISINDV